MPNDSCWICGRRLSFGTDGNGNVVTQCSPCRQGIEAMQAKVRRLGNGGGAGEAARR